jgi:hypothetical protein
MRTLPAFSLLLPVVLPVLAAASCSSGAAPPALDSGLGSGSGSSSSSGGHSSGSGSGSPDSGPSGFYVPTGCSYAVTPASNLGYTALALDDGTSAGPLSTATPVRVRLGLGGNVTAGQPGYADPTTTAAFTWETGAANHAAKVKYGESPSSLTTTQTGYNWTLPAATFSGSPLPGGAPSYMHEVHVCGLTPAKTYYYQVGGGAAGAEVWSATQTFTTLPAAGTSVTVAMSGDARDTVTTWQLANQHIKAKNVDAMLFSGDLVLSGGEESLYTNWLDAVWQPTDGGAFLTSGQIMFLPVAGNHEYGPVGGDVGPTAPQWISAFAVPGEGAYAKSFGSYNIGNAHFVYIEDNEIANLATGTTSPQVTAQLAFLNSDLAAADNDRTAHPFIFVYGHRGLFSTSNHAMDSDVLQARTVLAPIFAKYKVDGVFNGHDHEYERTVPIVPAATVSDPPTPTTGGTTYVICAGVGALPYAVGAGSVSWRAINVPFGSDATGVNNYLGVYATLTLSGSTVVLTAYGLLAAGNDTVIDTFTFTH